MQRTMFVPALWPLLLAGSCSRPCVESFSIGGTSDHPGVSFGEAVRRVLGQ